MEIISLLGVILDRVAFGEDLSWDSNEDLSLVDIDLPTFRKHYLLEYAESLLELDDVSDVEWNECKEIKITFKDKKISRVSLGTEVHDVESCINRYVKRWGIEDVYTSLCLKIITLLSTKS